MTPKSTRPLRAALYIRISRDRPNEVSTAVQARDGRSYAAMKGWQVVEEYEDKGLSASKKEVVRPAYQRLLADVDAGVIDVVVIWKLDRLGRSVIELNRVAEHLRERKVHLVSIHDSIDTSTPGGRFVYTVLAALAQMESEQIALRVTAANGYRAAQGKPHGGSRTFGYEVGGTVVKEDEAALIQEAARRVLAGEGPTAIAKDWNARGVPTATGNGKWWPANLARIMVNHHVAGLRRYNGGTVQGDWPAIVDPELRERLLAHIADPEARATGSYTPALLSGLLYCASCGRRMSKSYKGERDGRTRSRYSCKGGGFTGGCGTIHVVADAIEGHLRDLVLAAFADPTFRAALRGGRRVEDVAAIEAKVRALTEQLDVLAEEWGEGKLGISEWRIARDRLRERLDAAEAELRGAVAASAPDAPDVPATLAELEAWWEAATPDARRALLRAALERVDVGRPTRPGPFDPARLTVLPRA